MIAGRYRLEAPVADGAMGRIWKADSKLLGAPVAVKVLQDMESGSNDDSSARLLLEAATTASLRHPAIVEVLDFGMGENQAPFIVMELLRGETLRELIARTGGLPAVDAVRLLLPILCALDCVHEHGIVHRDVKPDNIFLSRDAAGRVQPKLVDFGLARTSVAKVCLSEKGWLFGSPAYMSPEQARADADVDARTDLWALAVVLFEAIGGETPWEASNWPELHLLIACDPPPSLVNVRGVDEDLWRILKRGLAKDRRKRWQTSGEFAGALEKWLSSRGAIDDVAGATIHRTVRAKPPACVPTLRSAHVGRKSREAAVDLASGLRSKRRRASGAWGMGMACALAAVLMAVTGAAWTNSHPEQARLGQTASDSALGSEHFGQEMRSFTREQISVMAAMHP
jgi:serine/threonine-protein kinase